jgi:hypothetical protein
VNSKPQLKLTLTNSIRGFGAGQRAHGEGEAHGPYCLSSCLRLLSHLFKGTATIRGCSCNLVHEHRAGNSSPASHPSSVLDRDIVTDYHCLNLETLSLSLLGGETKIKPITSIVLDDQKTAFWAGHSTDRRQNTSNRRRGKHTTRHGSSQHTRADVASMGGLVPRSSAGDQRHTVFLHLGKIRSKQHVAAFEPRQQRVGHLDPLQHLFDYIIGMVQQFFRHSRSIETSTLEAPCRRLVANWQCGYDVRAVEIKI